jgi:hypothetical protein
MGIDYKSSIQNLLGNITQEQVDLWAKLHSEDTVAVEEFVSNFQDYDKDGLASLMAVFSMTPNNNDEGSLEKSEDNKALLFHKLMENRLKKSGLSDDVIEKQIIKSIVSTFDIDKLLKEEIRKGASENALAFNEAGDELFNKTALRDAIIAEHDAIKLYEQMADRTKDEKLKKLLLSIAEEEKVHVGELEARLNEMDSENESSTGDGKQEATDLLSKPIDKTKRQLKAGTTEFIENNGK